MTHTTVITASGTRQSPDTDDCPAVLMRPERPGRAFVVTRDDADADDRAALADEYDPGQEHLGTTPLWLPFGLMNLPTLTAFRHDHMHRPGDYRGRLEQLPTYSRSGAGFQAWLRGDPPPPAKQEWLDEMEADQRAGLHYWRVRILSEDLTDYELYSCQHGYALNSRFEGIRILRRGEHDIPPLLGPGDYHVFGGRTEYRDVPGPVVPVIYLTDGSFLGGGYLGVADERTQPYRDELDHLWAIAEPWGSWWSRHPELHDARPVRAA